MSHYANGYAFERRVTTHLEQQGYWVAAARGSHGLADLVAIKAGQILLVQVKGGAAGLGHDEWNQLLDLANRCAALAVVADRPRPGVIRYRQITAPHQPRSHSWPSQPFHPDEVAAAR